MNSVWAGVYMGSGQWTPEQVRAGTKFTLIALCMYVSAHIHTHVVFTLHTHFLCTDACSYYFLSVIHVVLGVAMLKACIIIQQKKKSPTTMPTLFLSCPDSSTASSMTRFMNGSNPLSTPVILLLAFSFTATWRKTFKLTNQLSIKFSKIEVFEPFFLDTWLPSSQSKSKVLFSDFIYFHFFMWRVCWKF